MGNGGTGTSVTVILSFSRTLGRFVLLAWLLGALPIAGGVTVRAGSELRVMPELKGVVAMS